eukprot:COSAG02_NODE_65627_length_257_cov_1.170886_1_plen_46_part_10
MEGFNLRENYDNGEMHACAVLGDGQSPRTIRVDPTVRMETQRLHRP